MRTRKIKHKLYKMKDVSVVLKTKEEFIEYKNMCIDVGWEWFNHKGTIHKWEKYKEETCVEIGNYLFCEPKTRQNLHEDWYGYTAKERGWKVITLPQLKDVLKLSEKEYLDRIEKNWKRRKVYASRLTEEKKKYIDNRSWLELLGLQSKGNSFYTEGETGKYLNKKLGIDTNIMVNNEFNRIKRQ